MLLGAIFCRFLSIWMLSNESTCVWVTLGGKCVTCGGTHFVRDFLSGRIVDAFFDNQFLFILAIYAIVSVIFLNLLLLFNLKFAKKALRIMYNIPTLIISCVSMVAFLLLRNISLLNKVIRITVFLTKMLLDHIFR